MLESTGIAIAMVHSILIVIDIVGNCLVCAIIKKNRDMRTPMNYLLVNLAIADIVYAAFIGPEVILKFASIHPEGMTGTVLCKLLTGGTVAWIGAASSVVTLVAIAIERYYAVVYPLGNKGKLTERKLKVIVLGSWMFSLVFCMPAFLTRNVKRNICVQTWPGQEWLIRASHWMWTGLIILALALMVGFYSRVVYTLWVKRNDDSQTTYQQRGVIRVRKRVTLMAVTVTALFGICWLTDMILHLVDGFLSYRINKDVYTVTHTMILFSSAANPFLYALINQNFREKIKGIICCARSSAVIHPAKREHYSTESANVTDPTHTAGPSFRE
ncbi:pyroglutamylated RF-amide peptide receptor-like [Oculina patagonica]